jgi:hypothetical protein
MLATAGKCHIQNNIAVIIIENQIIQQFSFLFNTLFKIQITSDIKNNLNNISSEIHP